MRIRIALGCSEADARRVLGDDNLVPARLTRKGQAISPFKVSFRVQPEPASNRAVET